MLTYFISKKFIASKKKSGLLSLISVISIGGITLGVAIVITAISILNGFENVIADKIIAFNSHIKITAFGNRLIDENNEVESVVRMAADSSFSELFPFIEMDALIIGNSRSDGVKLMGVSKAEFKNYYIRYGLGKTEDSLYSSLPQVLIGEKLRRKIDADAGDTITIATLRNNQLPSLNNPPAIGKFIIGGIFESGMAEYDDTFIIAYLPDAQKFLGVGSKISGYNLQLNDLSNLEPITKEIAGNLRYPFFVRNLYQLYRNIFSWLDLQREPVPVILGLIILVAVFNIIGTLLLVVIDRTGDIGILKSLGAGNALISRIVFGHGSFLLITGIVLGNILALMISIIQTNYNLVSLPGEIYFINSVPIAADASVYFGISTITFVLGMLAALIPGKIASKISPISAIRFN